LSDLLDWLESERRFPKIFWQERGTNVAIAACGSTDTLLTLPQNPTKPYFGALSFSSTRKDHIWDECPHTLFVSPEELRKETIPILHILPQLCCDPTYPVSHTPNTTAWEKIISSTLDQINMNSFHKVVLGRRTTLKTKSSPISIVRTLLPRAKTATIFLFQLSDEIAFLGATPEKLYIREGPKVTTEALAGTRKLDELFTPKEYAEFNAVKEFITYKLSPLCTSHSWEEESVVKTPEIQHLYAKFNGDLKQIDDHALIQLLHPTPAIGGAPQTEALAWIHKHEPFERGWYSSPIGWVDPHGANFSVGIRSALVKGKEMHLFAAAGIVKNSHFQAEWNELNLKMRGFIHE
jgi:menaquinone-specific isochorismate synthase